MVHRERVGGPPREGKWSTEEVQIVHPGRVGGPLREGRWSTEGG